MGELELLGRLVRSHLGIEDGDGLLWEIKKSPLDGRGVFTTKDIQVGEVIFRDTPLVMGPRAGINAKLHCVVCLKTNNLKACSKGCGLPVCSFECEQNLKHFDECQFIKNRNGNLTEISMELFRSLTPIRSLFLDENKRQFLLNLAKHVDPKHGFEIGLIKSKINLNPPEEKLMRQTCYILDANAFEIVAESTEGFNDFSMRGLYPIAALMNHSCTPNITHLFDDKQCMIVKASVFMPKGTEILTTYTTLLWDTAARRHHLWSTKHFYCNCQRCQDPKEFGACLSGLKCASPQTCDGILYPINAIDKNSKWKCDICGLLVPRSGIGMVQSALGSLLMSVNVSDPKELIELLKTRVSRVVPPRNHIAVELKCRVIWQLGRTEGNLWNEISIENLYYKEQICRELLDITGALGLGQSKLKGMLLYELYRTLMEIKRRKSVSDKNTQDEETERKKILEEAIEIMYEDFRVPVEAKLINGCNGVL